MRPELALDPDQLLRVRRFVVEMRSKLPIGIVDAYYDDQGRAICPMVLGICHHVGPGGDIEPCPILQCAVETIRDQRGIYKTIRDSAFLRDFRETAAQATRGCIVMEQPELVKRLMGIHTFHQGITTPARLTDQISKEYIARVAFMSTIQYDSSLYWGCSWGLGLDRSAWRCARR